MGLLQRSLLEVVSYGGLLWTPAAWPASPSTFLPHVLPQAACPPLPLPSAPKQVELRVA